MRPVGESLLSGFLKFLPACRGLPVGKKFPYFALRPQEGGLLTAAGQPAGYTPTVNSRPLKPLPVNEYCL